MYKDGNIYKFSIFKNYKNLIHGTSTKYYGSMKKDSIESTRNQPKFLSDLNIPDEEFVRLHQVHSSAVHTILEGNGLTKKTGDGMVTDQKNIFMGVSTGDCLPIFFYDPDKNTTAIIHAGYMGLLLGIIHEVVVKLKKIGVMPESTRVGIGPGIGIECYDVPEERVKKFRKQYPKLKDFYEIREQKYYLSLSAIAEQLLLANGFMKENIEVANICTSCHTDEFFSYRKDIDKNRRFMNVIGTI